GPDSSYLGFVGMVKRIQGWQAWEATWPLPRGTLRPYARRYFEGVFHVRDSHMMDGALNCILDASTKPPRLLLTPKSVEEVLRGAGAAGGESHNDFINRLCLAVAEKTGRVPKRKARDDIKELLMKRELESEAPDYIRQCRHPFFIKYALWKARGDESAK